MIGQTAQPRVNPRQDVLFYNRQFMQISTMGQATIYLQDALTQMKTLTNTGKAPVFSIKVRTLNKYSKTGGRLLVYPEAKLVIPEENPNVNQAESLRYKPKKQVETHRNPRHFENKTRNIKVLPQNQIKKIGIRHIIEFNNQKVIY